MHVFPVLLTTIVQIWADAVHLISLHTRMILFQTVKQILVLHNNEEKSIGKRTKILNWVHKYKKMLCSWEYLSNIGSNQLHNISH